MTILRAASASIGCVHNRVAKSGRIVGAAIVLSAGLIAAPGLSAPARADLRVVASVKPVHSLVASIMQGLGQPGLIVDGAGSPHAYSLKPSQAVDLEKADLVFWIGHELEAFLEKPITSIAVNAGSVELLETPDLTKRAFREGGPFEDHGDEDHDVAKPGDHDNGGHDADGHAQFDPHIWLDPQNAGAMAREIESALSAADPDNSETYRANLAAMLDRLDNLEAEVRAILDPVKGRGFVVFHDAYQYFEARFGLNAAGSVTVNPDVMPGAERIGEILKKVGELGATCVFAEPQFEAKLISVVIEGTEAKSGILDPLGADLEAGPELYFELIRGMAISIRTCLSQAG